MAGRYEKQRELGSGNFGKAWLVLDKTNKRKCVLKEIKVSGMNDKETEQALAEVSILARCKHYNIIRYCDAYIDKKNATLNIAMEYADGGDLQKAIQERQGLHFSKEVVLDWFVQICVALKFIHSQHILHRDLKPQNIFLTSGGTVKLGDFGIAKILEGTMDHAMTTIGTPYYLSPEICQKQPYNYKSDIWAAGCILYEMCCLRVPFDAPNFPNLVFKILSQKYQPIPDQFGPLVEDLVKIMLQTNPELRPSASEILSIPSLKIFVKKYVQKFREASEKSKHSEMKKKLLRQDGSPARSRSPSPMVTHSPSAMLNDSPSLAVMTKITKGFKESPRPKLHRKIPGGCLSDARMSDNVTANSPGTEAASPDCVTTPDFIACGPQAPVTEDQASPEFKTPDSLKSNPQTPRDQILESPVPADQGTEDQRSRGPLWESLVPEGQVLEGPIPEGQILEYILPEIPEKENVLPVPSEMEKPVHPAMEMLRRREENYKKFSQIADKENLPLETLRKRSHIDPKARRYSMVTPRLNELVKKQKTERKYMSVHRPVPKRPEKVKEGPAPTFSLFREVLRSKSFSGELPKIIGTGGRCYSVCGVLPIRHSDPAPAGSLNASLSDSDSTDNSACSLGDDDIFGCTACSVEADLRELQIDTRTYSIHRGRRMSLLHSSPQQSPDPQRNSTKQLQVLYQSLVENTGRTKFDGSLLRSYLEDELGCEKFRALYNLVLSSAKTNADFDSLKTTAKERIAYLPAVVLLLQLEKFTK